jgi:CheY-like chemotaxis protein
MPVILMSAYCNEERRRAARVCGAQALLEKPVNAEQLAKLFGGGEEASISEPERRTLVPSVFR